MSQNHNILFLLDNIIEQFPKSVAIETVSEKVIYENSMPKQIVKFSGELSFSWSKVVPSFIVESMLNPRDFSVF